ncbi:DDE-type integrase/transposase/recombinase [Lysinibacillus fusiformis]|nr:DDE-type integrase/transposase/recombinase [Lysinibacillus fusiformis]
MATKPNQEWVTDVTEFHLFGEKLYLAPVLELFNGGIIAYNLEKSPIYRLVSKMLEQAFTHLSKRDAQVLHSDQGWHYPITTIRSRIKRTWHYTKYDY